MSRLKKRVEEWKLKLIDLSRRNRLIYFNPTKRSNIKVERPDMKTIFERLVIRGRGWEIWQPPPDEAVGRGRSVSRWRSSPKPKRTQLVPARAHETDGGQLERTLRNLHRRSTSEYRERGVRILYITFGMLNWREVGSSQYVRSPIFLTPIELGRETRRDPYKIQVPSVEDEVVLNPALRLKLEYDLQIVLPPLPDFEEYSLEEYFEAVSEIGRELGWFVEPVVEIGLFSFHKLVIYQDLSDNIDHIAENPIISALSGDQQTQLVVDSLPAEEDLDNIVEPEQTFQVLDADGSQQLCIQYALLGQSFVMHGPPGTGKSQTIANIISEFIAAGKSILFVSEKMAALDIVYNRLREKGLDDFCLELHSHKANKREVVAELSRALSEHLKPRMAISDADLMRLKMRRAQLNSYVVSLHRQNPPSEVSSFELLGQLTRLENVPFVSSGYSGFSSMDPRRFLELEDLINRLTNTWSVVEEGEGFPWRGCTDTRFTPETRSEWISILDGAYTSAQMLMEDSSRYTRALDLPRPETLGDYEWLNEVSTLTTNSPRPPSHWLEDADLGEIRDKAGKNLEEYAQYWETRRALEKTYDNRFFNLPWETSKRIEEALKSVKQMLAPDLDDDSELLGRMEELAEYLIELPSLSEDWEEIVRRLRLLLGLTREFKTVNEVQRLAELAYLSGKKNRPEADWLDRKRLQDTRTILEEARKNYERRSRLRENLEAYHEALLTLELDPLIEWFEGPGRSVFRYLRPSYYRIRDLILQAHRSGNLPKNVLEDLISARELVALEDKIASRRGTLRKALGSYFSDEGVDFVSVEAAMKIADKALKVVGTGRMPQEMVENLSTGSEPSEELLTLGRGLRESLSKWRSSTRKLRELIPSRRLPTTRRSLRSSDIGDVVDWASQVRERLTTLSNYTAQILTTCTSDYPFTYREMLSDLEKLRTVQSFEESTAERREEQRLNFGRAYTGLTTDWNSVLSSIEWTSRLRRLLADGIPETMVESVSEDCAFPMPPDPEIGPKLEKLKASMETVQSRFEATLWVEARQTIKLESLQRRFQEFRSRVDEIQTWVDFKDLESKFKEAGLGDFYSRLTQQRPERDQLLDIFQKSMYQGLLDLIFDEEPALNEFRGQDHEKLIEDFQELDRRFIRLSANRVIEIANQQKPQGVFVQAPDSEITILQREAVKKRRHMPIRHLFDRIPDLLRRLKPCLLMSPISVSQFLIPGRLSFDLVVFDEASQIYTEEAVGAIYRGDQLIVAGDNKQLPPTPFFQHTLDENFDWDESDENEFDVFDSVLDECMSIGLPVKMLRWHYRSRHDSLINFSNERFYNGRLVLFPSAMKRDAALGLKFVYIPDGIYNRGGARNNPREAEAVADLVFEHFSKHPEKTLGVVTFSISQMNTVQDALESRLFDHPKYEKFFVEDRLNGFFVKNLENVQGDERDTMIFSVGYGYDAYGRITMNFGPLNKPGGERRLNVAVTRAREKVILVSSIKASDFNLEATKAAGVHSLHQYLRYAERGGASPPKTLDRDYGSPFEKEVAEEVKKLGFDVVPLVGSSSFRVDLGVVDPRDPDRFVLGILCDGRTYLSASNARDRDRLRQQVLERLGWRIHKVWSPDWVQRRETELKRLGEALTEATRSRRRRRASTRRTISRRKPRKIVKQARLRETTADRLPGVQPYNLSKHRPRHNFSRYSPKLRERYLRQYRSEVRRILPTLVRREGPIHMEHALNRLNSTLGLRRATPPFKEAFEDVASECIENNLILVKDEFLWPTSQVNVKVRVPIQGVEETVRPIKYIPQEEIRKAMTIVSKHSLGLSPESLLKETAHLLGYKRLGKNVEDALTEAFQRLKEEGVLILRNGRVILAENES